MRMKMFGFEADYGSFLFAMLPFIMDDAVVENHMFYDQRRYKLRKVSKISE